MHSKSSSVTEECFTFLRTTSLAIPNGPHIQRKSLSLDSNRLQMPHDKKKKRGVGEGRHLGTTGSIPVSGSRELEALRSSGNKRDSPRHGALLNFQPSQQRSTKFSRM